MSETVLWLIRHPEPAIRGICYGSLDVPLSAEGVRQAYAIADTLRGEAFAAIYTSPLQRCADAARILAEGRGYPAIAMDGWRELDFGEFEGRSYDELAAAHPEVYRRWMEAPTEVEFPGGESFAAMRRRVLAAAVEVRSRHAGERVAVMAHGGAIRIVLAEALGMDWRNLFRIEQGYGAVNVVRYFEGSAAVGMVNGKPWST